jgi:hypothetical protein
MASYAIDQTKAGTVIQAAAGTLVSIQMTASPSGPAVSQAFDPADGVPTSGYLALVDNSVTPHWVRRLSKKAQMPAAPSQRSWGLAAPTTDSTRRAMVARRERLR